VLKSLQAVKEEAAKAAASENYDYGKGHSGGNIMVLGRNEEDCASQNVSFQVVFYCMISHCS
jgi:hypothetical protein